MESVRKGLRRGALAKDNYERLRCADCDESLKTESEPDEVYTRRACPECGAEWKEIG